MNPKFQQADSLTKPVLDSALQVHKYFGPGLLESIHQRAIARDCEVEGIPFKKEVKIPIAYRGEVFHEFIRADLFVDDCLLVELKAIGKTKPEHIAQTLSYMKLLDAPIGLIINFFGPYLKNGIRRLTLTGAVK